MLDIFLTNDFQVEGLLYGAPSCSEAFLFFSNDLLLLRLQSVQYDPKYDFAWVADEADRSVDLAVLRLAFLESVMTKDWVGFAILLTAGSCCRLS